MADSCRLNRLLLALGLVLLLAAAPAAADPALEVQRMIVDQAMKSRVPPALALAVARVESNFEPGAVSPAGARGVMQIMPKTARDVFGVHERDLFDARLNIRLGIDFLEQLYDQYGQRWELALSHYNGGTLAGGGGPNAIPHDYTRKYVADVLRWQRFYADPSVLRAAYRSRTPARPVEITSRAPGRRLPRIDPLEFDDWANAERRRLASRRFRVPPRP